MSTVPILLIVFNRPEHTQKTLESLLVQRPSELYVYQDGPRVNNTYDLENCQLVRNVIDEQLQNHPYDIIVHKYYSDINRGCRDAIINAITSVLEVHESVIIIEDDIITSPAFLTYMNTALDHYKNNMSVHSISGYSPSPCYFELPDTYRYDVFASPRFFGWGWGTWRNRWSAVDWSMSYYDEFIRDTAQIEAFNRGGDDMTAMLIDEKEGRSSAWDVQFLFDQFKKHSVSIVPNVSFTKNIGCDGTGTHCGVVKSNDTELCQKTTLRWLDTLYFDKKIINLLYNTFTKTPRPLWQKAINYVARKLGKKAPFVIKKKVYA